MAKIALCGYGHDGRGTGTTTDGYAYIVNNNVNVGDRLQVIATSRKNRKFVTTASPNRVIREDSAEGKIQRYFAETDIAHSKNANAGKIEQAYTGKEVGAKGFRGSESYQEQTRAKVLEKYAETHPNAEYSKNSQNLMNQGKYQSFDEYSKPYN